MPRLAGVLPQILTKLADQSISKSKGLFFPLTARCQGVTHLKMSLTRRFQPAHSLVDDIQQSLR